MMGQTASQDQLFYAFNLTDHSTFSKNRHGRFRQSDALRFVFESVPKRCMTEGLVRGEGFAIDASGIKANANRARGVCGTEVIDWRQGNGCSRAVREYLDALEENNPTAEDSPADQPEHRRRPRTYR
jgi:hypothetical protein